MKQRWFHAGVLVLLLSSAPAAGQGRDDGSLYSRYGLGELRSFASSRAQAMGGGGTALWSLNYANYANPATLSRQFLVRASAGMRFDNITTIDGIGADKTLLAGSFSAVQFGLPVFANRLGLGFAFEPYSRVNYRVTTDGALDFDPTRATTAFRVVTQGSGGLQQLRLGLGLRLASLLSIGASMDYLFGVTQQSRRTSFDSVNLITSNVAHSTRMRGVTTTVGTIVSFSAGEDREISIGGTATLPATLSAERTHTLGESLDLDTLGAVSKGDISLPVRTAAGIAFSSHSRWAFTADMRFEPWTEFHSALDLPGYDRSAMRNRRRISAGVELLPAGSSVTETYLARTAYRLGFYRDVAYISPVPSVDITIQAVTAGVSLPTLFGGTRLDINVQVGRRGRTSGILVRDRFVTLSATLNVGERWFLKRRLG